MPNSVYLLAILAGALALVWKAVRLQASEGQERVHGVGLVVFALSTLWMYAVCQSLRLANDITGLLATAAGLAGFGIVIGGVAHGYRRA
jgi:hypothetical protein